MVWLVLSRSWEELEPSVPSESANRFICSSVFSRYRSILGLAKLGSARLSTARPSAARHGWVWLGSAHHGPTQLGSTWFGSAELSWARLSTV